ncbi:AAA family ATPase [Pasteurella canis]|uniref:ATP-dependent nuclease n=1 Tax=Pasteurella canis TaxID=753 RepID=UPI001E3C2BC9|nr:ATP-binding protein [Pasteurella canis]UEA16929.1 AAA family ATPase [Pasteurella canis]
MKIVSIRVNNFKSLFGEHTINIGDSNIVCFVGENNTGKTTIFSAIDFLINGVVKEKTIQDYKTNFNENLDVEVEITLQGNIIDIIEGFEQEKYKDYIFYDGNNTETIRLRRSSKKQVIQQGKKNVELDESKITAFNPKNNQFENTTGFDKAIGAILETQFIWSEMSASDVIDFSSTKILGKLLKGSSEKFKESEEWRNFQKAHNEAFISGPNAFNTQAKPLVDDIQRSLRDFYGKVSLELKFDIPDAQSFTKLGSVFVDDGVNTIISEKGSGMQRALALSIIKVYSDILSKHKVDKSLQKPIFFFIDEPEISLHPKAQATLISALKEISKYQQIFITTHSPHFLQEFGMDNLVYIVSKENTNTIIKEVETMNTFSFSPTLAEVNYFAYQICTTDFHNELYGYIESKLIKNKFTIYEWVTDNFHNIKKDKVWIKQKKDGSQENKDVTKMVYIRHCIHHPENTLNIKFTPEELESSIKEMLSIIKSEQFKNLS